MLCVLYFALACVLILFPLITPDAIYIFYNILFVPVFLVAWAITALYFLAVSVAMLMRKDLWRAASAALLVVLVLIMTNGWGGTYRNIADWEHFSVMRQRYEARLARMPDNGIKFAEFNWGGLAYASRGVVYDETDEIGLPAGKQSRRWISRMKNTDLLCGADRFTTPVRPLRGHFYLTTFGC